jgi:hypothetical protein
VRWRWTLSWLPLATRQVRGWCDANKRRVSVRPNLRGLGNPIEATVGPLRQCVIANSDHADHPAPGRAIRSYRRWRKTHTRHHHRLRNGSIDTLRSIRTATSDTPTTSL